MDARSFPGRLHTPRCRALQRRALASHNGAPSCLALRLAGRCRNGSLSRLKSTHRRRLRHRYHCVLSCCCVYGPAHAFSIHPPFQAGRCAGTYRRQRQPPRGGIEPWPRPLRLQPQLLLLLLLLRFPPAAPRAGARHPLHQRAGRRHPRLHAVLAPVHQPGGRHRLLRRVQPGGRQRLRLPGPD